jgi:hypothetical protein
MDTKGIPTDGTHYRTAGYVKIGQICALRWLNMQYNYGLAVPVAYQCYQPEVPKLYQPSSFSRVSLFDVSGRKIGALDSEKPQSMSAKSWPENGIFIFQFNQPGKSGNSCSKKKSV